MSPFAQKCALSERLSGNSQIILQLELSRGLALLSLLEELIRCEKF